MDRLHPEEVPQERHRMYEAMSRAVRSTGRAIEKVYSLHTGGGGDLKGIYNVSKTDGESPAYILKAVDTIGNCPRLNSTVGVSQNMHKITNL